VSYPLHSLLVASGLLLLVAGWDLARRRIPNWTNAALAVTGLGAQALYRGGWALLSGLAAALVTLVVLWGPWSKGRLGGGDVKAALCAAIWLGLGSLLSFYLLAAVAGGLAAVICLLLSSAGARREVASNLKLVVLGAGLPEVPIRAGAGRISVPFGAAAAAAALFLLWSG
jgi:leader peptidase (prepilin peptidase)/N-methyltransferase